MPRHFFPFLASSAYLKNVRKKIFEKCNGIQYFEGELKSKQNV